MKQLPKPEHQPKHGEGTFYFVPERNAWRGAIRIKTASGKIKRRTVQHRDEDTAWARFQTMREEELRDYNGVLDPPREDWWRDAACKNAPTGEFFQQSTIRQQAVIETYCDHCPVKRDCLSDAFNGPSDMWKYGIWGGTTFRERKAIISNLTTK